MIEPCRPIGRAQRLIRARTSHMPIRPPYLLVEAIMLEPAAPYARPLALHQAM